VGAVEKQWSVRAVLPTSSAAIESPADESASRARKGAQLFTSSHIRK
jgi:hypothetical protein